MKGLRNKFNYMVLLFIMTFILAGVGLFNTEDIMKGDFLLNYRGTMITEEEANLIEDQSYLYFFNFKKKTLW